MTNGRVTLVVAGVALLRSSSGWWSCWRLALWENLQRERDMSGDPPHQYRHRTCLHCAHSAEETLAPPGESILDSRYQAVRYMLQIWLNQAHRQTRLPTLFYTMYWYGSKYSSCVHIRVSVSQRWNQYLTVQIMRSVITANIRSVDIPNISANVATTRLCLLSQNNIATLCIHFPKQTHLSLWRHKWTSVARELTTLLRICPKPSIFPYTWVVFVFIMSINT